MPLADDNWVTNEEFELRIASARLFYTACMRARGFEYVDDWERTDAISDDASAAMLDDWFGVSMPRYAAEFGYHEVPQEQFFLTTSPTVVAPTDAAYQEALFGASYASDGDLGGCYAEYETAVSRGRIVTTEEANAIRVAIRREREQSVRVSSVVAEASTRWSGCMASEGYDYADPHAAMADFVTVEEFADGGKSFAWKTPAPSDEEKRVAVQDATCKEDVGFWDAVDAAELDAEAEIVERMLPQLEDVKASRETEIRNMEAILASAAAG
jgi:hypothetical protein